MSEVLPEAPAAAAVWPPNCPSHQSDTTPSGPDVRRWRISCYMPQGTSNSGRVRKIMMCYLDDRDEPITEARLEAAMLKIVDWIRVGEEELAPFVVLYEHALATMRAHDGAVARTKQ